MALQRVRRHGKLSLADLPEPRTLLRCLPAVYNAEVLGKLPVVQVHELNDGICSWQWPPTHRLLHLAALRLWIDFSRVVRAHHASCPSESIEPRPCVPRPWTEGARRFAARLVRAHVHADTDQMKAARRSRHGLQSPFLQVCWPKWTSLWPTGRRAVERLLFRVLCPGGPLCVCGHRGANGRHLPQVFWADSAYCTACERGSRVEVGYRAAVRMNAL